MDIKHISGWVHRENFIYFMKWNQKPCIKTKVTNRGKRSKTLSEIKPIEKISKGQSHIESSHSLRQMTLSCRPTLPVPLMSKCQICQKIDVYNSRKTTHGFEPYVITIVKSWSILVLISPKLLSRSNWSIWTKFPTQNY